MRTYKKIWALCLVAWVAFLGLGAEKAQAQPGGSVSFQTFYDELEPYGRWINDPTYGYVWAPEVERDFQPYATRGHWVVTEYGNTWVSDYDWGWAPFHYGRWHYNNYYGWVWVPGHEWGPAWVAWRSGGGYYGWTPLGPGMAINVTINIPAARWIFVPQMYITSPRIYSYYVPRTTVVNIYHNTTYINNYYERDRRKYVYGPRINEIERYTRNKVQVYRVNDDNRPGRARVENNSVRIYRPQVAEQRSGAPSRLADRNRDNVSRSSLTSSRNNTEARDRVGTPDRNGSINTNSNSRVSRDRNENRAGMANSPADRRDESRGRSVPEGRGNMGRGNPSPAMERNSRDASPQPGSRSQREETSYGRQNAAGNQAGATRQERSFPQRSEESGQREQMSNRSMGQREGIEGAQRQSRQGQMSAPGQRQSQSQRVEQSSSRQQGGQAPQRESSSSRENGGRGRRN